jgi:hypothetical protein
MNEDAMGWLPKSWSARNTGKESPARPMSDQEIERRLADIQRAVGGRSAVRRDPPADPLTQESDWNQRAS